MTDITFEDIAEIGRTEQLSEAGGVMIGAFKIYGNNLQDAVKDNVRSSVLAADWAYGYCLENDGEGRVYDLDYMRIELSKF